MTNYLTSNTSRAKNKRQKMQDGRRGAEAASASQEVHVIPMNFSMLPTSVVDPASQIMYFVRNIIVDLLNKMSDWIMSQPGYRTTTQLKPIYFRDIFQIHTQNRSFTYS